MPRILLSHLGRDPVPVAVPEVEGEAGRDRPAKSTGRDAQIIADVTGPAGSECCLKGNSRAGFHIPYMEGQELLYFDARFLRYLRYQRRRRVRRQICLTEIQGH